MPRSDDVDMSQSDEDVSMTSDSHSADVDMAESVSDTSMSSASGSSVAMSVQSSYSVSMHSEDEASRATDDNDNTFFSVNSSLEHQPNSPSDESEATIRAEDDRSNSQDVSGSDEFSENERENAGNTEDADEDSGDSVGTEDASGSLTEEGSISPEEAESVPDEEIGADGDNESRGDAPEDEPELKVLEHQADDEPQSASKDNEDDVSEDNKDVAPEGVESVAQDNKSAASEDELSAPEDESAASEHETAVSEHESAISENESAISGEATGSDESVTPEENGSDNAEENVSGSSAGDSSETNVSEPGHESTHNSHEISETVPSGQNTSGEAVSDKDEHFESQSGSTENDEGTSSVSQSQLDQDSVDADSEYDDEQNGSDHPQSAEDDSDEYSSDSIQVISADIQVPNSENDESVESDSDNDTVQYSATSGRETSDEESFVSQEESPREDVQAPASDDESLSGSSEDLSAVSGSEPGTETGTVSAVAESRDLELEHNDNTAPFENEKEGAVHVGIAETPASAAEATLEGQEKYVDHQAESPASAAEATLEGQEKYADHQAETPTSAAEATLEGQEKHADHQAETPTSAAEATLESQEKHADHQETSPEYVDHEVRVNPQDEMSTERDEESAEIPHAAAVETSAAQVSSAEAAASSETVVVSNAQANDSISRDEETLYEDAQDIDATGVSAEGPPPLDTQLTADSMAPNEDPSEIQVDTVQQEVCDNNTVDNGLEHETGDDSTLQNTFVGGISSAKAEETVFEDAPEPDTSAVSNVEKDDTLPSAGSLAHDISIEKDDPLITTSTPFKPRPSVSNESLVEARLPGFLPEESQSIYQGNETTTFQVPMPGGTTAWAAPAQLTTPKSREADDSLQRSRSRLEAVKNVLGSLPFEIEQGFDSLAGIPQLPHVDKGRIASAVETLDSGLLQVGGSPSLKRVRSRANLTSTPALEEILAAKRKRTGHIHSATAPPSKNYHPHSLHDLVERISSFRESLYPDNKPVEISALRAALNGWSLVERNTVACVTCEEKLVIDIKKGVSPRVLADLARFYADKLLSAHSLLCPWRMHPCSTLLYKVPMLDKAQLVSTLMNRARDIDHVVDASSMKVDVSADVAAVATQSIPQASQAAAVLALMYWEPASSTMLKCPYCGRKTGPWLYQNETRSFNPVTQHASFCAVVNALEKSPVWIHDRLSWSLAPWKRDLALLENKVPADKGAISSPRKVPPHILKILNGNI